MGRLPALLALAALTACVQAPGPGGESTPATPLQTPAPAPLPLPTLLLLPATDETALEVYDGNLALLAAYGALAKVVLGLPDHTDIEGVAPPEMTAAALLLEPHEWQAVSPEEMGPEAAVVWPAEWGGGALSVPAALERLEARALAGLRARWDAPAPWPGFALPLTAPDGSPASWPDHGLVVLSHPLLLLPDEARTALGTLPWVAVGAEALGGPWPAPGPWVAWVSLDDLEAARPAAADTLPLLLWFEGGEVVRWKAGLPPLEWLEPWTS